MGRALAEYVFGTFATDRDYELARRRLYREPERWGLFKLGNLWCARRETLARMVARLESGEAAAGTSDEAAPEIVHELAERITRAVLAELAGEQPRTETIAVETCLARAGAS